MFFPSPPYPGVCFSPIRMHVYNHPDDQYGVSIVQLTTGGICQLLILVFFMSQRHSTLAKGNVKFLAFFPPMQQTSINDHNLYSLSIIYVCICVQYTYQCDSYVCHFVYEIYSLQIYEGLASVNLSLFPNFQSHMFFQSPPCPGV